VKRDQFSDKVYRALARTDDLPDEFRSYIPRLLQDNVNVIVQPFQIPKLYGENWKNVGDPSQPSFQNGWTNVGGLYAPASFYKDFLNFVHLRGEIKSGTINLTAFTLPAGYRPEYRIHVGVDSNNAHGVLEILPDGEVLPVAGSNLSFQLDVHFRAFS
jgi:hypothetical protein